MLTFRFIPALLLISWFGAQATFGAALERWIYCAQNLWVDKNIDQLEALFQRAAKAGYTHVLLTDSKFSKLGDMDARYFRNVERVKKAAADAHLEIVPALFSIGYSNDLLWHDPNLIEALPVRDALFVGSTYGPEGITVAVRIGFDDNRSLGPKETGGRLALPRRVCGPAGDHRARRSSTRGDWPR